MIEIQNLTASYVDMPFARRVLEGTFKNSGIHDMQSVGIVFMGERKMRRLNSAYHNENRVTDVLSFPSSPKFIAPKFYGSLYLGEIVVCAPYIKKEALYGHIRYRRMLAHALIHGTLHLLGYEHEKSEKDLKKMHAKEEKIMDILNV